MKAGVEQERKVSVIIPAYNCEKYVQKSIHSILSQSYRNLEILIADDASTDSTRALIDSIADQRITICHNDNNQGYLKTVNKLLLLSTGDYVTFQDADDWSDPERIELQVNYLVEKGIEICGTGTSLTTFDGRVTGKNIFSGNTESISRNAFLGLTTVCYASLLFTREVLNYAGIYRPFFRYGAEDVDWFYRIIEKYDCGNIEKPLYYYRFSGTSITDSINILMQIASLRLARDLAEERLSGKPDTLQRLDEASAERILEQHLELLNREPFSEELYKLNQLLRKRAYRECLTVCNRLLKKEGPWTPKLAVLGSCFLKLILGVDKYRLLRLRLSATSGD